MLNFISVLFCTAYIRLWSVLGFRVKAVMVEVIWLNFISGPVT